MINRPPILSVSRLESRDSYPFSSNNERHPFLTPTPNHGDVTLSACVPLATTDSARPRKINTKGGFKYRWPPRTPRGRGRSTQKGASNAFLYWRGLFWPSPPQQSDACKHAGRAAASTHTHTRETQPHGK